MNASEAEVERIKKRQRDYDVDDITDCIRWFGDVDDDFRFIRTAFKDHDTVALAVEQCTADELADFLIAVAKNSANWKQ